MKLDAVMSNQSLPSFVRSYVRANAQRKPRMRAALNAAHARLRMLKRHAVQSLPCAHGDVRANLLAAIERLAADIRLVDGALNAAQRSGTLADVWPQGRKGR